MQRLDSNPGSPRGSRPASLFPPSGSRPASIRNPFATPPRLSREASTDKIPRFSYFPSSLTSFEPRRRKKFQSQRLTPLDKEKYVPSPLPKQLNISDTIKIATKSHGQQRKIPRKNGRR